MKCYTPSASRSAAMSKKRNSQSARPGSSDSMTPTAVKLDSFSYVRFADGSSLLYGPDGKPLSTGCYALTDIAGNQITMTIQCKEEARAPRTQAEAVTDRRIQQANTASVQSR